MASSHTLRQLSDMVTEAARFAASNDLREFYDDLDRVRMDVNMAARDADDNRYADTRPLTAKAVGAHQVYSGR